MKMEDKLQQQIAFYLTGRRTGSGLQAMDGGFRPALFARRADLASLRYDFPIVLNREGTADRSVLSLTGLVDDAVAGLAEGTDRVRIARHGYRLEREIRHELATLGSGDLARVWSAAADKLAVEDATIKDSAMLLWNEFYASGDIIDVVATTPAKTIRHAWGAVQASKTRSFRQRADRLLFKLRDILEAEMIGSASGRTPDRLRAGVGSAFAGTFDFDALSRILDESKPGISLSDKRRDRIRGLIEVLERQRFFPLGDEGPEPYEFVFDHCSEASHAYSSRLKDAVELIKSLAIAELEVNGEYRESVHDVLFEGFGANDLDAMEIAQLPDYLVCLMDRDLEAGEVEQLTKTLASGLPFKILFQTDDVIEYSEVNKGRTILNLRARQLMNTAIGLTDVFVFQSSAAQILRKQESLLRGLTYDGPALFSVFSGVNEHTSALPAYLVASAAAESRVFPSLVYDPSAGPDWADRLCLDDNPAIGDDWPVHKLIYEDADLQAATDEIAFTAADFLAMDDRFIGNFALVPESDWNDAMTAVAEALLAEPRRMPDTVPYISLVDRNGRLRRAIVDNRIVQDARRCRTMWKSLQELGGIHNSHAERLLARAGEQTETPTSRPPAAVSIAPAQPVAEIAIQPEVVVQEPAAAIVSDDPYIESARCTSCNECTNVNSKMFAYDDNKQAYIADPDAGTFRQLVEAAEGCQVSIIHPGKPRNPKEPGLEDLIIRAGEFN